MTNGTFQTKALSRDMKPEFRSSGRHPGVNTAAQKTCRWSVTLTTPNACSPGVKLLLLCQSRNDLRCSCHPVDDDRTAADRRGASDEIRRTTRRHFVSHGHEEGPVLAQTSRVHSGVHDEPAAGPACSFLPEGRSRLPLRHVVADVDDLHQQQVEQPAGHHAAVPRTGEAQGGAGKRTKRRCTALNTENKMTQVRQVKNEFISGSLEFLFCRATSGASTDALNNPSSLCFDEWSSEGL